MARTPEAVSELRRALGAALRSHREASPLDQTEIGRATHYSRTSISHIEAGRQFPDRAFWETVDDLLGAHGDLLDQYDHVSEQERQLRIAELQGSQVRKGTDETRPSRFPGTPRDNDWQRDDVNRRELLRLMTATSTLLAIPAIDADRVAHAVEHPRHLDPATLDDYERLNAELWQRFTTAQAKRDVFPDARHQLATLNRALNEPQRADLQQRLSTLAGDLFQLCGEIFFDCDSYEDAAHCYSEAAHASKEARDFDLWACAMTRHAFVNIYEQKYKDAAPLLGGAAQLAARGDSTRSTRYWVAAVQAQTYAGLGNLAACKRALDQAEMVSHLSGQSRSTGWLRFEGSRLDEERGACYVTLQRPDLAEPVLQKALGRGISIRRRGGVLADLAVAGAQQGDVGQVLMYGAAALDTVRQSGSAGYLGRKVSGLRSHLAPYLGDRHVRYLDAQIKDTASAAAHH